MGVKLNKAKSIIAFGFLLFALNTKAQINFVQNPSFELYNSCPNDFSQVYICQNWDTLRITGGCGPDYYNACSTNSQVSIPYNGYGSFQYARTGNAIMQLSFYYASTSFPKREYIQNELKDKLKQNKKYCLTFYTSLQNESKYAITELGAYLDAGLISTSTCGTVTLTPQVSSPVNVFINDTLNWTKIQGTFTANGTESYLTLGNFKSTANTNFSVMPLQTNGVQRFVADYYIDDVSVIEADLPAYAGRDTVLCTGDSVFIGRPPEIGLECMWYSNNTQIGTGGGIWVKPTITQTFVVSQDVCGLIKTDTIQVQIKPKYIGTLNLVAQASPSLVCPTNAVILSVQQPTTNNYYFNWQPQIILTTNTVASVTATLINSTQFTVTAYNTPTDAFCPYSFSTTVNVNVKPTLTLTPKITLTNTINCLNDTLKFIVINTPTVSGVNYNWQPFNLITSTFSNTAKALIQNNSFYFVTLTSLTDDALNCPFTKKDSVYISLQDTCDKNHTSPLILPQLISANGDGFNDELLVQLPNTKSATLQVFNRWGNLVAELAEATSSPSTGSGANLVILKWNGTYNNQPLPAGTYFYIVESVNTNGEQKNYKQFVQLVR